MARALLPSNIYTKKGFSIMELVIALSLGAFVVSLIGTLFVSYSKMLFKQQQIVQVKNQLNHFLILFSNDFYRCVDITHDTSNGAVVMKFNNDDDFAHLRKDEKITYKYNQLKQRIERGTGRNSFTILEQVDQAAWHETMIKPLCYNLSISSLYDQSLDITLCR